MRVRHAGERPYRTKKYMLARQILCSRYLATLEEVDDRSWCYQRMAELGWCWDSAVGEWHQRQTTS